MHFGFLLFLLSALGQSSNAVMFRCGIPRLGWLNQCINSSQLSQLYRIKSSGCRRLLLYSTAPKSRNENETNWSSKYDANDCRITITAGTGGKEAFEWCSMLHDMYREFIDDYHGLDSDYEVHGDVPSSLKYVAGESHSAEFGYRFMEFDVIGKWAYRLFKGEKGGHRLIRNSPFNASKKRQTTFGGVQVVPILADDDPDVLEYSNERLVNEKDLIIETMRSSGKGGQNVNKVETAVRVTHKKTGLSLRIQQERSQARNREIAIKKISLLVEQHQKSIFEEKLKKLEGDAVDANWSSHIKSYVLNPQQRFTDHRSGYTSQRVENILKGDIGPILLANLSNQ